MTKNQRNAPPTQTTIAAQLGLSVGAVSRALAGDPQMAKETRDKVKAAAERLGYAPDRAAQRLRTGRTQVINLILPPHHEIMGFGTLLVGGITEGLEGTGFDLLVWPDHGPDQSLERIEQIVRHRLADGVIFSRTAPNDRRIAYLLEAEYPFVTHGRSEFATPHPYVDFDNYAFAKERR